MERARPLSREHHRTARGGPGGISAAALVGGVVLSALLLGGCDSVSGIPVDDPAPARAAASTIVTTATPPPTSTTAALAPPPADAPPVGEVPGWPDAAVAVRRWAADLRTATLTELQAKCWTIAPGNAAEMYQGKQAILNALAQPGVASANAATWKSRATTVTVERDLIHTGYACPRVFPAGSEIAYNDADARHTVRRYLARLVGSPLDAADREADYPLVCKATPATWDPKGTGSPTQPPLAVNSAKLSGITEFDGQEISSARLGSEYLAVEAPVTDSTGTTKTRTFTVAEGPEGYCIGDVTS
ncbi:hypothetical protein [Nocardia arizonensis]|uniref:hypothetical protein n=1 Tax=Nocardia arizonensis TaxID=1141647 RepID=UPI0006D1EFA5|nr:hypothetical protein [Nocardia arizonensis]